MAQAAFGAAAPLATPKIESTNVKATSVFDVIYTFDGLGQEFEDITTSKGAPEATFVKLLLNGLNLMQVEKLVKISICQYADDDADLEPWLMPRHGKFYFNPDVNDDPDTKHWAAFRDKYLADRRAAQAAAASKQKASPPVAAAAATAAPIPAAASAAEVALVAAVDVGCDAAQN
jgi:hypothetical protein